MEIKQMNLAVFLLVFSSILLLSGCGTDKENEENIDYISSSPKECSQILFTCPQYYSAFSDDSGCGCIETKGLEDNVEERSLNTLVKTYLSERMVETKYDGLPISTFIFIDSAESQTEEGKPRLKYQAWAGVNEYYISDEGGVQVEELFNGPVVFDITETGKNYIINGDTSYTLSDNQGIEKNFTLDASAWILDKTEEELEATKQRITDEINNEASQIFGQEF